jgi:hypothetical protein
MIPRILHYCWLSGDPLPDEYRRCVDGWREKLPGWDFVLWDTKRFDLDSTLWTRQAFDAGLYACAADYIRLYAVCTMGGVYLDTDMEVVKPLDPLLGTDLLLAYENHISRNIEAGCFGAAAGHPYIKACMAYFEETPLYDPAKKDAVMALPRQKRHDFINPLILPEIMAGVLETKFAGQGYTIHPHDWFTAKNVVTGEIETTENTYTIHHFGAQYHSQQRREAQTLQQRLLARYGVQSAMVKLLIKSIALLQHIDETGLRHTVKRTIRKHIKHERPGV